MYYKNAILKCMLHAICMVTLDPRPIRVDNAPTITTSALYTYFLLRMLIRVHILERNLSVLSVTCDLVMNMNCANLSLRFVREF